MKNEINKGIFHQGKAFFFPLKVEGKVTQLRLGMKESGQQEQLQQQLYRRFICDE